MNIIPKEFLKISGVSSNVNHKWIQKMPKKWKANCPSLGKKQWTADTE